MNAIASSIDPAGLLQDWFPTAEDFSKSPDLYQAVLRQISALTCSTSAPYECSAALDQIARLAQLGDEAARIEAQLERENAAQAGLVAQVSVLEQELARLQQVREELAALQQVAAAQRALGKPPPSARSEAGLAAWHDLARVAHMSCPDLPALPLVAREQALGLLGEMRAWLEADLGAALKQLGWPRTSALAAAAATPSQEQAVQQAVSRLVGAQQAMLGPRGEGGAQAEFLQDLWIVPVLVKPVLARFQYHFCWDRPTNRIDRPEWAVAFCVQTLRENRGFLADVVQPLVASELVADVWSQFVRELVRAVHARMQSHVEELRRDAALLCHTVDELLVGDLVLLGELGYSRSADDAGQDWPVFSTILESSSGGLLLRWWIEADYKFARQRLDEVLPLPTSWLSVKDSLGTSGLDSSEFDTPASDALLASVRALGMRFQHVASHEARLEFFRGVVARIVAHFVDAAQSRPSAVEAINALAHVADGLQDIKLTGPFLNLDSEPRPVAVAFTPSKQPLQGLVTRAKDFFASSSSSPALVQTPQVGGGAFDAAALGVRQALDRCLGAEATSVFQEFLSHVAPLEEKSWTFTLTSEDLSVEACPALQVLKKHLRVWESSLNPVSRVFCERELGAKVARFFTDALILSRPFSLQGALQLQRDVRALVRMFAFKPASLAQLEALAGSLALDAAHLRESSARGEPAAVQVLRQRVDVL